MNVRHGGVGGDLMSVTLRATDQFVFLSKSDLNLSQCYSSISAAAGRSATKCHMKVVKTRKGKMLPCRLVGLFRDQVPFAEPGRRTARLYQCSPRSTDTGPGRRARLRWSSPSSECHCRKKDLYRKSSCIPLHNNI